MKSFLNRWTMLVVLLIGMGGTMTARAQGAVSFQVFYDELQPYGTWMNYGSYGYVWIPQVERDFMPYGTNGYWVNTEYGNTWVSDYAWGWAPFHYGRWLYDDFYGWIWVPGNEWAPAWVAWRNGGGYYGWAPLMPGMGISVTVGIYDRIPNHCWNFVPYQYITYHRVYAHCVPRPTVVNIIHQTTIVTYNHHHDHHYAYFTGPSRHEMERDGRTRVERYRVDSRHAPGRSEVGRGTVAIYRPHVAENTRLSAAPTRVAQESEMRRHQQTVWSQRDREPEMQRSRDMREDEQRLDRPRSEAPHRDAEVMRGRQREDHEREQRERVQEERQQQERMERMREQQQLQDRRPQEGSMREQQRQQQERVQQERMQEQQRNQQQERMHEQQLQERRQQENNMRGQQRQQERIQQVTQEQQRNRQEWMREQQNLRQQQQMQNRQRMEQQPLQNFHRERTPGPERHDNGGGQRRRH